MANLVAGIREDVSGSILMGQNCDLSSEEKRDSVHSMRSMDESSHSSRSMVRSLTEGDDFASQADRPAIADVTANDRAVSPGRPVLGQSCSLDQQDTARSSIDSRP